MTRGNQRENDRARAAKKLAANTKAPKVSASSLKAKQEADAEKMRAKNAAALERKSKEEADALAAKLALAKGAGK